MHHAEIAEPFRKVPPRQPGAIAIKNCLHKRPVVFGRAAHRTPPPGKQSGGFKVQVQQV